MTSAQLVNLKGKSVGEVNLDDSVFGVEIKEGLLYDALHRQLANARSGSANTKIRSEVRGGGRKPWRQKGTGRARAGSTRSPLWSGGGVVFGPRPHSYALSMPKKARQAALKSALSAKRDALVIVKDFNDIKEAKTKTFAAALKDLGLHGKKTLIVLDYGCETCETVTLAARNIAAVKVVHVNNLSVKDLVDADTVLTQERVIEVLNNRFKPNPNGDATTAGEPAPKRKAAKKAEAAAPAKEAKPKAAKAKAEPKAKADSDSAPAKATKKKADAGEKEAPKAAPKKKKED
jgi:large subunit ribosomal protein L4